VVSDAVFAACARRIALLHAACAPVWRYYATEGRGLGRASVRLLKRMAFRDLKAHRSWLDVKSLNQRATALYASEGFVEEGRLRESVRAADGQDSLVVMSLLDRL
jgi:diamine N-acetyltransferase